MSVTDRIREHLTAARPPNTVACPVCGARYDAPPLNCAACGNETFE